MSDTMRKTGLLKEAQIFLTHLARTLLPSQAELEARTEAPFIVCFDGMESTVYKGLHRVGI